MVLLEIGLVGAFEVGLPNTNPAIQDALRQGAAGVELFVIPCFDPLFLQARGEGCIQRQFAADEDRVAFAVGDLVVEIDTVDAAAEAL